MDTDDLSNEAYNGIIIEAERFNHDLTLRFGVLASSCKNEEEYLTKALKLVNEIKELDEYDLEDLFFGTLPNIVQLYKCLDKIALNIEHVKTIHVEQRHYEF